MSSIIASNSMILRQLEAARAVLNGPCSFRLFKNDYTPHAGSLISSFVESSFPGYARINTANYFGTSWKVVDGLYQSTSSAFISTCTANTSEFVYGWWIVFSGMLLYACRFTEPIAALNATPISVSIALQEGPLSL